MLKTFIRFTQTTDFCVLPCGDNSTVCRTPYYDSVIPAKASDAISFIVNKSDYNLFIGKEHLYVALSKCGELVELASFSIEQSTTQYYITCVLSSEISDGAYELILFIKYKLIVYSFIPETSPGACDAIVNLAIDTPPAVVFVYSIDGVTWNESAVFAGLCMQSFTFYVKEEGDDDCTKTSIEFNATPIDCGSFQGDYLQQLDNYFITQLSNCYLSDMI